MAFRRIIRRCSSCTLFHGTSHKVWNLPRYIPGERTHAMLVSNTTYRNVTVYQVAFCNRESPTLPGDTEEQRLFSNQSDEQYSSYEIQRDLYKSHSREIKPAGGEGARDSVFRRSNTVERNVHGHLRAVVAPLVPRKTFNRCVPARRA